MLPDDRRVGPIRRVLRYFGLLRRPDAGLGQPSVTARPADPPRVRSAARDAQSVGATESASAKFARSLRTLAEYFGLADDPDEPAPGPGRSRYGDVAPSIDNDIDNLRARVAELEQRLAELSDPR